MSKISEQNDDLRAEYVFDYATGVKGKYHEAAMRAKRMVEIDEDLLKAFPSGKELNAALRGLVEAARHVKAGV